MQGIIESNIKTITDPKSHQRQIEKEKMIPDGKECGHSLVDSFTGDHKFNNFKAKQTGKERQKLSEFIMTQTQINQRNKQVLQDNEIRPFQEERPNYNEEKKQMLIKVTDEVR